MSKRLSETFCTIFTDDSLLSFEDYSPHGGLPSRVLRIGGQQIVDMGNYCNTCALFFEHFADPEQRFQVDALADQLAGGVHKRNFFRILNEIYPLLPQGAYEVSLLELRPRFVRCGSPQDYFVTDQPLLWIPQFDEPENPHIDYYRAMTQPIPPDSALFEFAVPLYDVARLDPEVVERYVRSLAAGEKPTAMAISILDRRQPAMWAANPPVTQHYLLAHYLLDGHHKMLAAAKAGRPLTLLSFLPRDLCMASLGDVATVFRCLDSAAL
jgi:hypothetical protein